MVQTNTKVGYVEGTIVFCEGGTHQSKAKHADSFFAYARRHRQIKSDQFEKRFWRVSGHKTVNSSKPPYIHSLHTLAFIHVPRFTGENCWKTIHWSTFFSFFKSQSAISRQSWRLLILNWKTLLWISQKFQSLSYQLLVTINNVLLKQLLEF